jgi:hypothetical protein
MEDTEQELPLVAFAAKTVVDGPFAESTLRLSFDNPHVAVRPTMRGNSGALRVELPEGARLVGVRRLMRALRTKDKWVDESFERAPREVVETAEAWLPVLDGRGTEEVELRITHVLGARTPLRWLLAKPESLRLVDVEVRARGADGPLLAERHFGEADAKADFVFLPAVTVDAQGEGVRGGEHVAVRVPLQPLRVSEPARKLLALVDTSGSGLVEVDVRAQEVATLLRALGPLPTTVVAFDQAITVLAEGPADAIASRVQTELVARQFFGGTDVEAAFAWAAERGKSHPSDRVLLVSDGVATVGRTEEAELRAAVTRLRASSVERLDVVALGARRARRNDTMLASLVSGLLPRDGLVLPPGGDVAERVAALSHEAHCVRAAVPGARWAWPAEPICVSSALGGEALVFAALAPDAPVRIDLVGTAGRKETRIPMLTATDATALATRVERAKRDMSGDDVLPFDLGRSDPRRAWAPPPVVAVPRRVFPTAADQPEPPRYVKKAGEERRKEPAPRTSLEVLEDGGATMKPFLESMRARASSCCAEALSRDWDTSGRVGFALRLDDAEGGRVVLEADDRLSPALMGCLDASFRSEPAPKLPSHGDRSLRGVFTFAPTTTSLASLPPRSAPPAPLPPARLLPPRRSEERRVYVPVESPLSRALSRLAVPPLGQPKGLLPWPNPSIAYRGHDEMDLLFFARKLTSRGEIRSAERVVGTLFDRAPDRADIRRLAGARLEAIATPSSRRLALEAYRGAIEAQPEEPLDYHLLAWAMLRAGDPRGALAMLEEGLRVASRRSDASASADADLLRDDAGLIGQACVRASVLSRSQVETRLAPLRVVLPTTPSTRLVITWEGRGAPLPLTLRDANGVVLEEIPGRPLVEEPSSDPRANDVQLAVFRLPSGTPGFELATTSAQVGARDYLSGKIAIVIHDGAGGLSFVDQPLTWTEYVDIGGNRPFQKAGAAPGYSLFRYPLRP